MFPFDIIRRVRRTLIRWYHLNVGRSEKMRAYYAYLDDNRERDLLLDFPLGPESVVFDVGGYVGDYAARILCKYGCRVEVFEPVADFSRQIKNRFSANPRVTIHPFGLAGRRAQLYICKSNDASSTIKESVAAGDKERVRIEALQDVVAKDPAESIDLIKINIEGGEYELLEALTADFDLARSFEFVLVQFHDFVPDAVAWRERLHSRLAMTHDLDWEYPFVWECWKLRPSVGDSASF